MVLCFIALPIFLILGIFSVKYRILAKDALECLGRTVTFRKCRSRLDERIKSELTGKILKKSPKIGIFFYKNFQLMSTITVILLVASLFFSITGLVNYVKYGNCNGENSSLFCVIGAAGGLIGLGEPDAQVNLPNNSAIILENITIAECQKKYNMSINECLAHCNLK